jgi:hypothetical protein
MFPARRLLLLASLLALAVAAVPAVAAVKRGSYKGKTDQNRPVTFKVSGGKVRSFQAGVMTWCSTSGNNRFVTDAIANVPALKIRSGKFRWVGKPKGTNEVVVKGTITGGRARGTVTISRPDSNYSNGQYTFGSCVAKNRKWTAKVR